MYGCVNQNGEYLETCVDDSNAVYQIENAFQQQLDLSDAYKSKQIFEKMKNMFHDQTMEGINGTKLSPEEVFPKVELEQGAVTPKDPLSVRDNLFNSIKSKEFFGSGSKEFFDTSDPKYIIGYLLLAIVVIYIFYKVGKIIKM
jgi:hypothetical protein